MWTRAELKDRAKTALRANYWLLVLAGVIYTLLSGGFNSRVNVKDINNDWIRNHNIPKAGSDLIASQWNVTRFRNLWNDQMRNIFVISVIIVLVVIVAAIVFNLFIINPLLCGLCLYFSKNLEQPSRFGLIGSMFSNNYLNCVKILFFKNLFNFFWYLLFLVPGVVKTYEYRMIPYIVAHNPDVSMEDAFAMSKQMMDGQKFDSFVLDLSFLGWEILSVFTFGILGVFFVTPYVCLTNAALYQRLSGLDQQNGNQANGYYGANNYYTNQNGYNGYTNGQNQNGYNGYNDGYTNGQNQNGYNGYNDGYTNGQNQNGYNGYNDGYTTDQNQTQYRQDAPTTSGNTEPRQTGMDQQYFNSGSMHINDDDKL